MKEIKSLKALARDLASEKQDLLIKLEHDAAIISNMSKEAMAKDDQLARLKISLEALVSGRSDGHIGSARSKADNDLRQYEDLPQVCESCEGVCKIMPATRDIVSSIVNVVVAYVCLVNTTKNASIASLCKKCKCKSVLSVSCGTVTTPVAHTNTAS